MSNHISFVCVWINFMPPLSSMQRNCIYSPFELTWLLGGGGGGGVFGRGDVKIYFLKKFLKKKKKN
jgi:hypothetical protein